MVTAELFASVPQSVGNITFTPDNRVIYSHHPFFSPEIRVAELNPDRKSFKPFPNAAWNTPRPGTDHYLDSVLGLRGDENGIVWMLDMGQRTPLTPKIVGWDTKRTSSIASTTYRHPHRFPSSQHNDFVVDTKNRKFYIADEGIGPGVTEQKPRWLSSTWIRALCAGCCKVMSARFRKIGRSPSMGKI